ncbi:MAG: acetoin utilization protein AcuC [Burkholderiales bacterium]
MAHDSKVCVYLGDELARYGFGSGHPFGPQRLAAFREEFERRGLAAKTRLRDPMMADQCDIERFHSAAYVERVKQQSQTGTGYLDYGDTPAFIGVYEAAAYVVGTTLDAVDRIMHNEFRRAFVPIAGLHHARRESAAGFCVFNDCAIAIEALRAKYGINRVGYVDIDAHHGDGVFYAFEDDPDLCFVDLHEDGRFLYPGTGDRLESGSGAAQNTKLNIPMAPGADDKSFLEVWPQAEEFLRRARPDFLLLQCGADSLAGDPITHMAYSAAVHAHTTHSLCALAEDLGHGRLLAMGGGGYNPANIASAWNTVVEALVDSPAH